MSNAVLTAALVMASLVNLLSLCGHM